jgi:hypothetical protein
LWPDQIDVGYLVAQVPGAFSAWKNDEALTHEARKGWTQLAG